MSDIFRDLLNDPAGVEKRLLGPSYPYHKNIKLPGEMGMSEKGSLKTLGKNIDGLISYVEVLVTGTSNASSTGRPLGNKFFLQTGAKCNDTSTAKEVDRYIYVDNVPNGNIPFISQGLGVNFSQFRGLVPGAMGNLNVLNPFGIMRAFLAGGTPDCQELTMETVDINNNKSSESHYVTLADIKGMNSCMFQNGKNPVTGSTCRETFVGNPSDFPAANTAANKTYLSFVTVLGTYALYKIIKISGK